MLNYAEDWTVCHAPAPRHIVRTVSEVQPRFQQDCYGEVNSWLRHVAGALDVKARAVILRDPQELACSFDSRNRRMNHDRLKQKLEFWKEGFDALHQLVISGTPVIWFDQMTTDKAYLQRIGEYLGIGTLWLPEDALEQQINATPAKKRTRTVNDCCRQVQLAYNQIKWFKVKYFDSDREVTHSV